MSHYYFLINFLPTLSFNNPLEMTFEGFENLIQEHLTMWDKQKVFAIKRYFDFFNFNKDESGEEEAFHIPELPQAFFQKEINKSSGFIKKYFLFEQELYQTFIALHLKKHQLPSPLSDEEPLKELLILLGKHEKDPLASFKTINEYRYNKIEEIVSIFDPFSIHRLLAYVIQFILVLRWQSLDKPKGLKIFDNILGKLP